MVKLINKERENMSLTEEAYFKRMWGKTPILAELLRNRGLHDKWYRFSTASDNIFEHSSRIIEILIMLHDHSIVIKKALQDLKETNDEKKINQLLEELQFIRNQSNYFKDFFTEMSKEINELFNN